ncbi:MAG TPA: RNA methyltransferase [Actinomycetota bacterium]
MSPVERITDPTDPRLRDFTELRDVQARNRREPEEGMFIAEGEATIRRAVASGYPLRAILTTDRWLASLGDLPNEADAMTFTVDANVLRATTGFPVHRGALASLSRLRLPSVDRVLSEASRVLVLDDLVDPTNVGAVFRSAAALGMDAIVLTPRCADPLYRRAVRTSMGGVFSVPWTRLDPTDGPACVQDAGFELLALTPATDCLDLRSYHAAPRVALVLGNESDGLSSRWLDAADVCVRIPMANGVDSLNVAAAAAVACFALSVAPAR